MIKAAVLVVLLAFLCNATPVRIEGVAKAPVGHKLEYLAALWRHGDRAPSSAFKGDLYNQSYWDNGYGQLTNYGIEQQRQLGEWIFNRYVAELRFLPTHFDGKAIKIQSTYYNRTHESALYNLRGMYGDNITYDELDIFSIPGNETDVVGLPDFHCAYANTLSKETLKTKEVSAFVKKHQRVISEVGDAISFNASKVVLLWANLDPFVTEKKKGLRLAPQYEADYKEMREIYVRAIRFTYGLDIAPQNGLDWRYESVRMNAGGLLTRVYNDLKAKGSCNFLNQHKPSCKEDGIKDLKYRVFSMHDTNMLGLLNSFGFPEVDYDRNDNVELASSFFIELWRSQLTSQRYVKLIYRRNATEIFDVSNQISGCKSVGKGLGCSLESFLKRTEKFVIPDFDEYCATQFKEDSETTTVSE
ncbi:unnamed protein product [Bursaphelenchus xylophilus]|uniref:acid phosphatase n=1 Tax=Bursaphelenchus xylophilus TaxID=6326 RepID=A0A1I7RM58_BURXY|nr:unnamed protein product [Bursaphelenchus xylophilus]CAG9118223.1 unnamed protein product [Bursaphelenchus xylophilus]